MTRLGRGAPVSVHECVIRICWQDGTHRNEEMRGLRDEEEVSDTVSPRDCEGGNGKN